MIGLNLIEDLFLLEPSSTTDELTIDSKTQAKEGPIISLHRYPSTGNPMPYTKFTVSSPFQKMYPHANLVPAFLVKTPKQPLKLVYTALRASPLS
jgi:hypothetical protein